MGNVRPKNVLVLFIATDWSISFESIIIVHFIQLYYLSILFYLLLNITNKKNSIATMDWSLIFNMNTKIVWNIFTFQINTKSNYEFSLIVYIWIVDETFLNFQSNRLR